MWSSIAKKKEIMDMGEGRVAAMDEAKIDFAYLSLTSPGVEALPIEVGVKVAVDANNVLAEAIAGHPDRFGGWATLAPKDVDHAVEELERCVKESASRAGTPIPTSAIPAWTIRGTGPSWRSARN